MSEKKKPKNEEVKLKTANALKVKIIEEPIQFTYNLQLLRLGTFYAKSRVQTHLPDYPFTYFLGKILEALQMLKDGNSFATVAEKMSEDKAKQGGSLGWLARGGMVGAFQGKFIGKQLHIS